MTIRLKYCGGCNPRYDRKALAERLRRDFSRARLFSRGDGEFDVVAVFCGCPARCARHKELRGRSKVILSGVDDYAVLHAACRALEAENATPDAQEK